MSSSTGTQVLVQEADWPSCLNAMEALHALGLTTIVCPTDISPLPDQQPIAIQLVILGLGHDSHENLQRLKRMRHRFPGAVVMSLCPHMQPRERCVLLDSGLDVILEKPFSSAECASTIRAILRRREMS